MKMANSNSQKSCPFNGFVPCREQLCGVWHEGCSLCALPSIADELAMINGSVDFIGNVNNEISQTLNAMGQAGRKMGR
ncbi:MAG: hypothetical protein ACI3V1_07455 [Faecousia sp.]